MSEGVKKKQIVLVLSYSYSPNKMSIFATAIFSSYITLQVTCIGYIVHHILLFNNIIGCYILVIRLEDWLIASRPQTVVLIHADSLRRHRLTNQ